MPVCASGESWSKWAFGSKPVSGASRASCFLPSGTALVRWKWRRKIHMTSVSTPPTWLAGYIPDLPTPFDESGAIDLTAFANLCERQIEAGVPAIVVCETAGEASTLTPAEQGRHHPRRRSTWRGATSASSPAPDPIRPVRRSNWRNAPKRQAPMRYYGRGSTNRCRPKSRRISGRCGTTALPIILHDIPSADHARLVRRHAVAARQLQGASSG